MSFLSTTHQQGVQCTNHDQWPGLFLSSSTTRLLVEKTLLPLCWFSNASTSLRHQTRLLLLLLLLHPFNDIFSRTTWVSRHQKGKPFQISLTQEMMGWQWHQLDYMQITCASLQTDNHARTSRLNIFTDQKPFLTPNQQRQSTEGKQD